MLVRGGQDNNDESDEDDEGNEGQEAMNKTYRREMRQKKRQERVEEGQSSRSIFQLMDMIASFQASMNSRFDALDGMISDIQERKTNEAIEKDKKGMHKRSLKGNLQRSKRSLKPTRFYEDEENKLKTLKKAHG
ncbi:hypothetical protein M9H77_01816 [Catharanthus roseus]|uniref:Uncharacterized protein n=1 Tax=Catharanthus roseus TaxID=4058 RepID=A0ACC0C6S4_CATRO|nr:hypothetical protein M9H77_01816 [Catharanthus roseus]